MPRPVDKSQLLLEAQQEKEKLFNYLSGLTREQKIQSGIVGEWSVKDMLAHLHEWHLLVLGWLSATKRGDIPAIPADGYNWAALPALNKMFFERNRNVTLEEMEASFLKSYQAVLDEINKLNDDDLCTQGLYPWMNKNTLAAYFNSCTTSHYRWALKEIRKGLKGQ